MERQTIPLYLVETLNKYQSQFDTQVKFFPYTGLFSLEDGPQLTHSEIYQKMRTALYFSPILL